MSYITQQRLQQTLAICTLISITGCSVLVHPDLNRLNGSGPDGSNNGDSSVIQADGTNPGEDVPGVETDVPEPMCTGNCDDNVPCTIDRCNAGNCVHTPDNTMCGPDARCDVTMGCVPNMMRCRGPQDCNDNSPCTTDLCDPGGRCTNTPVDADGDGAAAAMVMGTMCMGTDCNDNNRAVNPMAMEICADRIDNDCNGMIDDPARCPMMNNNTTCNTAARIDLTNTPMIEVAGDNRMGMDSVRAYCGQDQNIGVGNELWYSVTWPANRDLQLDLTGAADGVDPVLYLTTACGGGTPVCNDDIASTDDNSRVILRSESDRAVGNRTVVVAADSFNNRGGLFRLRASTRAPISARCDAPYDIGAGATIRSGNIGLNVMLNSACGFVIAQDFYRVRSNAGRGIAVTTAGQLETRSNCGQMGNAMCRGNQTAFDTGGDTLIGVDRAMGAMTPYVLVIKGP